MTIWTRQQMLNGQAATDRWNYLRSKKHQSIMRGVFLLTKIVEVQALAWEGTVNGELRRGSN